MITPSYSLTATERVLPKMALNFTTALLDSRVTFTRSGNTATVTNSFGVITAINANLPRFDFNPTTLVCNGLLIEESRTNLVLNSLIDGTNLSTQLVVTTAVSTTLSFYGTGQIVLSGSSSATVTGTGAYPSRKTYTFTPTVGTLTLTVTGTVQYAQLEVGAFATSFIPTAASQVTRTADAASMTGTNFSDWYNAVRGTLVGIAQQNTASLIANKVIVSINDNVGSNFTEIRYSGTNTAVARCLMFSGGADQFGVTPSANTETRKIAFAYEQNNTAASANASVPTTDTSCLVPVNPIQMTIGYSPTFGTALNGWIRQIYFYDNRCINNEIRAFSN